MAEKEEFRPGFGAAAGVTIPGPAQPKFMGRRDDVRPMEQVGRITHVRLTKGATIGDRRCDAGEVIKVSDPPRDAAGRTMAMNIMPPLPLLIEERARWLVEHRFAEPHPGPATHQLGASMDLEKTLEGLGGTIEAAVDPAPARAAQAVAPRQRGAGAI